MKVNFEVHCGEIWSRAALQERLPLLWKICSILRAVRCRTDVNHAGTIVALMLVSNRMTDVGMPEDSITRHYLGNRHETRNQIRMPLRAHTKRSARSCAAQISLIHVVLKGAKQYIGDALSDRNQA